MAPERDRATKHCSVQLPDGTSCVVLVRAGLSIKEVLAGLCERHGINGAAVDLFLAGGDKVRPQRPLGPSRGGPARRGPPTSVLLARPLAAVLAGLAAARARAGAACPAGPPQKRRRGRRVPGARLAP